MQQCTLYFHQLAVSVFTSQCICLLNADQASNCLRLNRELESMFVDLMDIGLGVHDAHSPDCYWIKSRFYALGAVSDIPFRCQIQVGEQ